jgi:hypothetical protein
MACAMLYQHDPCLRAEVLVRLDTRPHGVPPQRPGFCARSMCVLMGQVPAKGSEAAVPEIVETLNDASALDDVGTCPCDKHSGT